MKAGRDYIGVGVGAVIFNDDGDVLLLLRQKDPEKNCWAIPGGKVELFEKLEEALLREILEETGLRCEIVRLIRTTDHIFPQDKVHWVTSAFLAKRVTGDLSNKEPNKHSDARWFHLDALPQNLALPTQQALESFKSALESSPNPPSSDPV